MENRSFDDLLGELSVIRKDVNGSSDIPPKLQPGDSPGGCDLYGPRDPA
jgi:hypothetical protein